MKNCKRTFSLIILASLVLLHILCFARPVYASVSVEKKMKIRVGFFEFDGYHEIHGDGSKSGYGYEFLQMIAPYANFEYEYVGYDKSWADMQDMLEKGEIDLLTSARKTPARLEKFDFTDREIGFNSTMLTALPTNDKYTTNDYSTFDGMRVGMTVNNSRNDSFFEYAEDNGFSYTTVMFDDQEKMERALLSGEIDTMVTSDLRIIDNEIIIDKFDESGFYAIVKKGNKEVLDRVNYAINELSADSPSWSNNLSIKYYNNVKMGGHLSLTSTEKEYLNSLNQKGEKLKVLIRPERSPYSYFENGVPKGIFADVLSDVAERYDLPYEVIETHNLQEYLDMIDNKIPDVIFDSTYDYYQAEKKGYHLTSPYHTAQFCLLKRDDGPSNHRKIAGVINLSEVNREYARLYSNYEVVEYPSTKECVQAVMDKKVDATYLYVYTALKYVSEDAKGFLMYTPLTGTSTNFSIAVKDESDHILYNAMNRIASGIGEDDIQTAISNNTQFARTTSAFLYFVYHEPLIFAGIIAAIIASILIVVIRNARKQKIENEKRAQNLKDAYDSANQANQAKSAFLSNVSHDIRTPMNVIIGMTAIAEANIKDPKQVSECLTKIAISSRHLLSLINEVLDMSKIESGKISLSAEDFNLAVLLDNLMSMIGPQAKDKGHELVTNFDELKHTDVVGDSLRLQQVFMNIASNAIKYTPDGGRIEITATELDSDNPMLGKYKFIFKDNGIGMSKEYVQRIFEPFSREKGKVDKIQGTGLGMAIANNIINMMDGSITVESEQGIGSKFTILLNLKLQEKTDEQNETQKAPSQKTSVVMDELRKTDYSSKRILVVEDFEMNLTIIKGILGVTGMEIDSAGNGKIAVEKFEQSSEGYYDMIFMDICMPEMDGYEATRRIRALEREDARKVPIIALTADAFAEDVEKAINAGMNEHLSKPLEIPRVSAVLKKWL